MTETTNEVAAGLLKEILAVPTTVTIGDREIGVTPIRLEQLPRVLELIAPIRSTLAAGQKINFMELMLEHSQTLAQLSAELSGQPLDWVNALNLRDAVNLASACWGVNASFFALEIAPALSRLLTQVFGKSASSGPSPGPQPEVQPTISEATGSASPPS